MDAACSLTSFRVGVLLSWVLLILVKPAACVGQDGYGEAKSLSDPQANCSGTNLYFASSACNDFPGAEDLGVLVAQYRAAEKPILPYVCLIKSNYDGSDEDQFPLRFRMGDRSLRVEHGARVGGSSVTINYNSTIKSSGKAVGESLKINGVDLQLDKGRVFYIDLTKSPLQCEQIGFTLPSMDAEQTDLGGSVRELWNQKIAKAVKDEKAKVRVIDIPVPKRPKPEELEEAAPFVPSPATP